MINAVADICLQVVASVHRGDFARVGDDGADSTAAAIAADAADAPAVLAIDAATYAAAALELLATMLDAELPSGATLRARAVCPVPATLRSLLSDGALTIVVRALLGADVVASGAAALLTNLCSLGDAAARRDLALRLVERGAVLFALAGGAARERLTPQLATLLRTLHLVPLQRDGARVAARPPLAAQEWASSMLMPLLPSALVCALHFAGADAFSALFNCDAAVRSERQIWAPQMRATLLAHVRAVTAGVATTVAATPGAAQSATAVALDPRCVAPVLYIGWTSASDATWLYLPEVEHGVYLGELDTAEWRALAYLYPKVVAHCQNEFVGEVQRQIAAARALGGDATARSAALAALSDAEGEKVLSASELVAAFRAKALTLAAADDATGLADARDAFETLTLRSTFRAERAFATKALVRLMRSIDVMQSRARTLVIGANAAMRSDGDGGSDGDAWGAALLELILYETGGLPVQVPVQVPVQGGSGSAARALRWDVLLGATRLLWRWALVDHAASLAARAGAGAPVLRAIEAAIATALDALLAATPSATPSATPRAAIAQHFPRLTASRIAGLLQADDGGATALVDLLRSIDEDETFAASARVARAGAPAKVVAAAPASPAPPSAAVSTLGTSGSSGALAAAAAVAGAGAAGTTLYRNVCKASVRVRRTAEYPGEKTGLSIAAGRTVRIDLTRSITKRVPIVAVGSGGRSPSASASGGTAPGDEVSMHFLKLSDFDGFVFSKLVSGEVLFEPVAAAEASGSDEVVYRCISSAPVRLRSTPDFPGHRLAVSVQPNQAVKVRKSTIVVKQAVPIVGRTGGIPRGTSRGATTCTVQFLELADHGGWVFDVLPVGATKRLFELVPQQAIAASSAASASASTAAPASAKQVKAVASPAPTPSKRSPSKKRAPTAAGQTMARATALDAAGGASNDVAEAEASDALANAPPPLAVLVHMLDVALALSKRVACPTSLIDSVLSVLAFVARTTMAARDASAGEAADTRASSCSSSRSHSPEGGASTPSASSAAFAPSGSEEVLQYLALGAMGIVRAQAQNGAHIGEMLRRGVLWLLLPLIAAPGALASVALKTTLALVACDTARAAAADDEGGEGDAPFIATAARVLAEILPLSLVALLTHEAPLALRVLQCPAYDHEDLSPAVALNIMWTEQMMAEAMAECAFHCDAMLASRFAEGGVNAGAGAVDADANADADAAPAAGGAAGFRAGKGYRELEGGLILGGVVVHRLLASSSLIARIAESATETDAKSPGFFDTVTFIDGALDFMCRAATSPPPTTPPTTPRAAGGAISDKAWALVEREQRSPQMAHPVDLVATARCAAQCVLLLVESVPQAREACCSRDVILRLFALLELLSAGAYSAHYPRAPSLAPLCALLLRALLLSLHSLAPLAVYFASSYSYSLCVLVSFSFSFSFLSLTYTHT